MEKIKKKIEKEERKKRVRGERKSEI